MDYSYDTYGNAGGFNASQMDTGAGGGGKDYDKDSLRPVTIKQLIDAQSSHGPNFAVDGQEITQITLVGQVRNISVQSTNILYKLDDGTGTIEVKQWVNADGPTDNLKVSENAYARVWGKLESFNDKKYVSCRLVRPVEDLNETSYHFLEAAYVHLYYTRGPPEDKNAAGLGHGQGGVAGGMQDVGADAAMRGLSPPGRKVYQLFKTAPQNNEGLHMQDIASRLGMDTMEVMRAGDELLSQGLIYTTVDDNTWNIL